MVYNMEDSIYNSSLNEFISIASSKNPTPGGGNVSSVVATLGASMIAMVANLTISNKKYVDFHNESRIILDKIIDNIEKLKILTSKDIKAFNNYMKCFRLPKNTDEEKLERNKSIQDAAKNATLVPLEICKCCLYLLSLASELSVYGNKMAISDIGVGVIICEASLRACMLSVDINVPVINDEKFVENVKNEKAIILTSIDELKILSMNNVIKRMK